MSLTITTSSGCWVPGPGVGTISVIATPEQAGQFQNGSVLALVMPTQYGWAHLRHLLHSTTKPTSPQIGKCIIVDNIGNFRFLVLWSDHSIRLSQNLQIQQPIIVAIQQTQLKFSFVKNIPDSVHQVLRVLLVSDNLANLVVEHSCSQLDRHLLLLHKGFELG
jgi:hypothetical protein